MQPDLRERVIRMADDGTPRKTIAEACGVTPSSIARVLLACREVGDNPAGWAPDRHGDMPDSLRTTLYDGRRYDLSGARLSG